MEVGFVGLGRMGAPMALNLLKVGHRVTVYNRTRSKAEALAGKGAQVADRVADACLGDALITMLSDDAAVESVIFSDGGALYSLRADALHISMSTISVALSDRLTEAHGSAGQGYAAAPVFGRPDAAAAKLFIIAAGAAGMIARCDPLFAAMGQRVFSIGGKLSEANCRQADRQLPDRIGIGDPWRSFRAYAQIRYRCASLFRCTDWHAVLSSDLSYLRFHHRRWPSSRERFQDVVGLEGHTFGARGSRRQLDTDAGRELGPGSFS
jgi:NAD binding domain of 6-phosphogluconate dehydrogenase